MKWQISFAARLGLQVWGRRTTPPENKASTSLSENRARMNESHKEYIWQRNGTLQEESTHTQSVIKSVTFWRFLGVARWSQRTVTVWERAQGRHTAEFPPFRSAEPGEGSGWSCAAPAALLGRVGRGRAAEGNFVFGCPRAAWLRGRVSWELRFWRSSSPH